MLKFDQFKKFRTFTVYLCTIYTQWINLHFQKNIDRKQTTYINQLFHFYVKAPFKIRNIFDNHNHHFMYSRFSFISLTIYPHWIKTKYKSFETIYILENVVVVFNVYLISYSFIHFYLTVELSFHRKLQNTHMIIQDQQYTIIKFFGNMRLNGFY